MTVDALSIYKEAYFYPEVQAVFTTKPIKSKAIDIFQNTLNCIQDGSIYRILGNEYCNSHNIAVDDIAMSVANHRLHDLTVEAIRLYAKIKVGKVCISDFAINYYNISSNLLQMISRVVKDKEINSAMESIKVSETLAKQYEDKYREKLIRPLYSLVKWYRENKDRLFSVSYGTITISPLKDEESFIKDVSEYMLYKGPMYFNSPLWHTYTKAVSSVYNVVWEGVGEVVRKPDYQHSTVKLAGVTAGGYKIC